MNSATSSASRRPPRRVDAHIDISPTGVLVNGEPVAPVGTEQWLAAGIRAASERVAIPLGEPIRARVVNGPCRTRLVIHPDGSLSDVEEYVVPAWLGRMAVGDLLARQRIPLIVVTAVVGVITLVGGVVLASGDAQPEASPAAATTSVASAGVGDLRREVMYAAVAPVVVAASMTGGRRAVVMEAAAEPSVEARWILRDPDGRLVVDRVVTLDAEPRRFRRSGLAPGDYRWALVPRGDGEARRGTVTVTRKGAPPSTDAPASPDDTGTPDASPRSPDAPAPAAPGGRSGSEPTSPKSNPSTPKSDPPTSDPDPTTSDPDPTTSDPDPTTSDPDPTTSDPDPSNTSEPAPTSSGTSDAGTTTSTTSSTVPTQQ